MQTVFDCVSKGGVSWAAVLIGSVRETGEVVLIIERSPNTGPLYMTALDVACRECPPESECAHVFDVLDLQQVRAAMTRGRVLLYRLLEALNTIAITRLDGYPLPRCIELRTV